MGDHFAFESIRGGGILYFIMALCFMIQACSFFKCHRLV